MREFSELDGGSELQENVQKAGISGTQRPLEGNEWTLPHPHPGFLSILTLSSLPLC